jgi:Zn-dependent protease with chaperone function
MEQQLMKFLLSLSLRLMLWLYFPLIALLCLGLMTLVIYMICLLATSWEYWYLLWPIAFCLVPLVQFLWPIGMALLFKREKDAMELELPRDFLREVYDLVRDVAQQWDLPPPQEIRLSAASAAHVYEGENRRRILVLGGVIVAAFPREALAGVVAHELAHFAAGDTGLSRAAARRGLLMAVFEFYFRRQLVSYINPLVWLLFLYHLVFRLLYCAHSRSQEYAADAYSVDQAGKENAAASLIYLSVTENLPWANLGNIIETIVRSGEPLSRVFAEQAERARSTSPEEWQTALKKALKENTGVFDSHPSLKDRLKAMGVSSKKALKLALDQTGEPVSTLIPQWARIEERLSDQLIGPYREYYLQKMEVAQILRHRPSS